MALVRWEPFGGLMSLRRDMDRLFEDFFERAPMATGNTATHEPAVDIAETDDSVTVQVQVPGVDKEQLQLEIAHDCLMLRGEMREEQHQEGAHYLRRECRYGTFARTIPLPVGVNEEQAKAQLKDGILRITIPKGEQNKSKRIVIETATNGDTAQGVTSPTGQTPQRSAMEQAAGPRNPESPAGAKPK